MIKKFLNRKRTEQLLQLRSLDKEKEDLWNYYDAADTYELGSAYKSYCLAYINMISKEISSTTKTIQFIEKILKIFK